MNHINERRFSINYPYGTPSESTILSNSFHFSSPSVSQSLTSNNTVLGSNNPSLNNHIISSHQLCSVTNLQGDSYNWQLSTACKEWTAGGGFDIIESAP